MDIQWYEPQSSGWDYARTPKPVLDEYGRLWPVVAKFPSSADGKGFKPLADYVHAKGLKFGIHLMRGIPRQAVKRDCRILGTDVTASAIANTNSTCPWNPDMYGVDMSKPGAQAYYDSVFKLIADVGGRLREGGRPLAAVPRRTSPRSRPSARPSTPAAGRSC